MSLPDTWRYPALAVFVGLADAAGDNTWLMIPDARQGMPELMVEGPDGNRWMRVMGEGPHRRPEHGAPAGPWWYIADDAPVPDRPWVLPDAARKMLAPPPPADD